jgi:hypothetical protein
MDNARLFFPYEEGDDLFDLYEERLFEDKQFFTTKPLITKVFEARIAKIRKRETAFRALTNTEIPVEQNFCISWEVAHNLPDAYRLFQSIKSKLFLDIYSAKNGIELTNVVTRIFEPYDFYVQHFISNQEHFAAILAHQNVLMSQEPEPSAFAIAITNFEAVGGRKIEDAIELEFAGKELVLLEAKRLSLWRQKEAENGNL